MKIEKDVPVRPTHDRKLVYPFRQMEVGDSIRVELEGETVASTFARVGNSAYMFGRRNDM